MLAGVPRRALRRCPGGAPRRGRCGPAARCAGRAGRRRQRLRLDSRPGGGPGGRGAGCGRRRPRLGWRPVRSVAGGRGGRRRWLADAAAAEYLPNCARGDRGEGPQPQPARAMLDGPSAGFRSASSGRRLRRARSWCSRLTRRMRQGKGDRDWRRRHRPRHPRLVVAGGLRAAALRQRRAGRAVRARACRSGSAGAASARAAAGSFSSVGGTSTV